MLPDQEDRTVTIRSHEEMIAESTAYCSDSGRLTWVVLDWIIHHIEQIDEEKLLQETRKKGNLSVLGVLCDAAHLRIPHPKFERIIAGCVPHDGVEPFFRRVARSSLAARLARENALDVFRKWNYLCSELRYLMNSKAAILPNDGLSLRALPIATFNRGAYRTSVTHETLYTQFRRQD